MTDQTKAEIEVVAWIGYSCRDGHVEFSLSRPVPSVMRTFNMRGLVHQSDAEAIVAQKDAEIGRIRGERDDWAREASGLRAEIDRLATVHNAWKNGGYTNLWKQRTQDRDDRIEMQRTTLLELRDIIAQQAERIVELERERNEEASGWAACQEQLADSCRDMSIAEQRIAELERSISTDTETIVRLHEKVAAQSAALAKARKVIELAMYVANLCGGTWETMAKEALAAIDALGQPEGEKGGA